ncbi:MULTISPECIES: hypothetical protein [unclassified Streptomyces]|uniref:hypothetical protein n=1 Tax=unclassified Streptomyces TaxID=2593676 RepID=UPI001F24A462|nr:MULTISPECIES: hypothetical protein [unclassified Streptomyces]
MCGLIRPPEPPEPPAVGTHVVDAWDRVGEFRGEWAGFWNLRPPAGGREWSVRPEDTRPASPEQCLRAKAARANARSRGEVL